MTKDIQNIYQGELNIDNLKPHEKFAYFYKDKLGITQFDRSKCITIFRSNKLECDTLSKNERINSLYFLIERFNLIINDKMQLIYKGDPELISLKKILNFITDEINQRKNILLDENIEKEREKLGYNKIKEHIVKLYKSKLET